MENILDLTSFRGAAAALNEAVEVYEETLSDEKSSLRLLETLRAGVIQTFEVAYELSWKMIRRWLEVNYGSVAVDGVTRRELYRQAAENLLINDVQVWMDYHKARNQTSHTYDGGVAEDVMMTAFSFRDSVGELIKALETRNV